MGVCGDGGEVAGEGFFLGVGEGHGGLEGGLFVGGAPACCGVCVVPRAAVAAVAGSPAVAIARRVAAFGVAGDLGSSER